jgi:hypothetical protein
MRLDCVAQLSAGRLFTGLFASAFLNAEWRSPMDNGQYRKVNDF